MGDTCDHGGRKSRFLVSPKTFHDPECFLFISLLAYYCTEWQINTRSDFMASDEHQSSQTWTIPLSFAALFNLVLLWAMKIIATFTIPIIREIKCTFGISNQLLFSQLVNIPQWSSLFFSLFFFPPCDKRRQTLCVLCYCAPLEKWGFTTSEVTGCNVGRMSSKTSCSLFIRNDLLV